MGKDGERLGDIPVPTHSFPISLKPQAPFTTDSPGGGGYSNIKKGGDAR